MTTNRFIHLLIFFFFILGLNAQKPSSVDKLNECKSVVKVINTTWLHKIYRHYEQDRKGGAIQKWGVVNDSSQIYGDGWQHVIYLDEMGRIRKMFYEGQDEYSSELFYCYYDESGKLRYMIASSGVTESKYYKIHDVNAAGYLYSDGKGVIAKNFKAVHNGENGQEVLERQFGAAKQLPTSLGDMDLSMYQSTKKLVKHFKIPLDKLKLQGGHRYSFSGTLVEAMTTANENDVVVRDAPTIAGKAIGSIDIWQDVKVKSAKDGWWGTSYFIPTDGDTSLDRVGYVPMDCLEPVEMRVGK